MSEVIKNIISTYNDMSKSKKYNQSYLDGYRQCVVDAQESEPQLSKDQEIVLGWLKEKNPDIVYESPLFTIYQLANELITFRLPKKYQTALQNLNEKQITQTIKAFTDWRFSENE